MCIRDSGWRIGKCHINMAVNNRPGETSRYLHGHNVEEVTRVKGITKMNGDCCNTIYIWERNIRRRGSKRVKNSAMTSAKLHAVRHIFHRNNHNTRFGAVTIIAPIILLNKGVCIDIGRRTQVEKWGRINAIPKNMAYR